MVFDGGLDIVLIGFYLLWCMDFFVYLDAARFDGVVFCVECV